jgi:Ferritin-like domain
MRQNNQDSNSIGPQAKRRGLLKGAGIGAAALAFGGLGLAPRPAAAQAVTDTDILNFALNLEYLEAEFYLQAAYGQSLHAADTTGTGTLGTVTGGSQVPFTSAYNAIYAEEIAGDELVHVRFLRSALGSAAVARPSIDFSTSFTKLARAAGLIGPADTFNPFLNDTNFLLGAFIFEDVGVTAYHGAAALISDKTVLTAAAGILAVEAYHAGIIRSKLFEAGMFAQTNQIALLRAILSGAPDDEGVSPDGRIGTLVPVDGSAIAFARTTTQVLNIVYGGGAANNNLFFPNKLNGTIA